MMNRAQFLLAKLAEECAEVSKRALKQMQFGANQVQAQSDPYVKDAHVPETSLSNSMRLQGEVNDMLAVIDMLVDIGEIPYMSPYARAVAKREKREKITKYEAHIRTLGNIQ